MILLGIDPGLSSGALAVIEVGAGRHRFIAVSDVPTVGEGAKKRVDALAAMKFLRQHRPDHAFVERAQAMPQQGASSGFHYGRAVGALETCVVGLLIPHTMAEAAVWKRILGLKGKDKEASRQRALALYPDAHQWLQRKKDHDRAEAILLAHYGAALLNAEGKIAA